MNLTPNELLEDEVTCYVCGKDCHEAWFARIYEKERKVCLCGPRCAIAYLGSPRPPSHDHHARHEYYRVRTAVLEAARAIPAGERPQFNW